VRLGRQRDTYRGGASQEQQHTPDTHQAGEEIAW
jgi:hypothetical protein